MTVLGNWYGESICLHLGDNVWMIIDSFKRTNSDTPAALEYLQQIGVPTADVRALLVTHWDTDHILGVGDIAESCPNAVVSITGAMDQEMLVARATGKTPEAKRVKTAVRELCKLLTAVGRRPQDYRAHMRHAQRELPLCFSRSTGVSVTALSPTGAVLDAGIAAFADYLRDIAASGDVPVPNRIGLGSHENNHCSVAAMVHAEGGNVLLGADLEHVPSDPQMGWDGVAEADDRERVGRASLVKIPHHGSKNGFCDALWGADSTLVEPQPVAVLAPWRNGGTGPIPEFGTLEKLEAVTEQLWSASTRRTVNIKTSSSRLVEVWADDRTPLQEARPFGRVTARRPIGGDGRWTVTAEAHAARRVDQRWERAPFGAAS